MRIGVTGGCGYLGSVLVPELIAAGHKVEAIDLRPPETTLLQKIDPGKFRYHAVDVSSAPKVAELIGDFDLIIHLAALVGYPACEKDPNLALKWNVATTRNLIRLKNKTTPVV
jgi:nucleoside-diphosphate-sugar epimerase